MPWTSTRTAASRCLADVPKAGTRSKRSRRPRGLHRRAPAPGRTPGVRRESCRSCALCSFGSAGQDGPAPRRRYQSAVSACLQASPAKPRPARVMMDGMGTSADARDTPAGPGHTPYLPEPSGPCPVGTTSLWLTDVSRPDPWAAGVNARELMVSLWYPAAASDGRRARYMTPAESRLQLTSRGITGVPPDALSTVRTNAVSEAAPAGDQRALPLVVLSPGFTNARSALTALAEDLASHGYVVAGIDHTYESLATAFPDGRVTSCLAREAPSRSKEKVAAGRAADVSFVLGELTGTHPPWPGAALIDPSRIAMAGHSAGGAATIAAMLADSRIPAGI